MPGCLTCGPCQSITSTFKQPPSPSRSDKFFEMNVEDAKTALQLYQSAMTMHQSLSDFW